MHGDARAVWPAAFRYSVAATLLMMGTAADIRLAGQGDVPGVVIGGDLARPFTLTATELKSMPRTTLTVTEGGRSNTFDGVLIGEVLKRAGAPLGSDLSGKALASYVLATAADGYQAVYSLAEADPALTDTQLLVADTANGVPLGEKQGPMRLVAPHDKRAARSVRMLRRLDVIRLRP
jgi:DMSO/TMAO reductase YedYZ molybdopterin-dependent catalytic subunit